MNGHEPPGGAEAPLRREERTEARPPIDVEAFRASMERVGSASVVDVALRMFGQRINAMAEDLQDAVTASDGSRIADAAHVFKSSAYTVFARDLGRGLDQVEALARRGELDACEAAQAKVFAEVRRARTYLASRFAP